MIYHSNNRNAYNQVTQITPLNFNWGTLGVSSYLLLIFILNFLFLFKCTLFIILDIYLL